MIARPSGVELVAFHLRSTPVSGQRAANPLDLGVTKPRQTIGHKVDSA